MRKLTVLKSIQIKDASYEYIDDIISLIRDIYGDKYPEKEFYDKKVIYDYITESFRRDKICWKCAFLNGEMIGQLLAVIRHNIGYIKLTMVKKEYRKFGILTLITFYMLQLLKDLNDNDLKYIYAFISNKNTSAIRFIPHYEFSRLGAVPAWECDNYYIPFGRMVYDKKWKLISPHIKLCPEIFQTLKNAGLKRYISIQLDTSFSFNKSNNTNIEYKEKAGKNPHKISVIDMSNGNAEGEIYAQFYENKYQKSWYDVHFINDCSFAIKTEIIRDILKKFEEKKDINSLSFSISINDRAAQKFLLDLGLIYYAYLPFYRNDTDMLLMGKSKISMERINDYSKNNFF